jgi:hypothetical protein
MSRGRRTLAALAAVVAMIGVAVVVRGALHDDGGEPPPPSATSASNPSGDDDGRPTLACAQELEPVCAAIAERGDVKVVVQPAGQTAARLSALQDDEREHEEIDGWLTIDPQPGIVDDAHTRVSQDPIFGKPETLARSPLVFVVWKDRLQVLVTRCGSPAAVTWKCLGDLAGDEWTSLGAQEGWGAVKLAHADAANDTVGLVALGQEATSKLGRVDISSADIEDLDFSDWFVALEQQEQDGSADGPLAPMLQEGPSRLALAQVSEAEACTRLRHTRFRNQLDVVVPSPVTTADVVFAPRRGRGAETLREAVSSEATKHALAQSGWRPGSSTKNAEVCSDVGSVQLEQSNNAPPPGVLVALRELGGSS